MRTFEKTSLCSLYSFLLTSCETYIKLFWRRAQQSKTIHQTSHFRPDLQRKNLLEKLSISKQTTLEKGTITLNDIIPGEKQLLSKSIYANRRFYTFNWKDITMKDSLTYSGTLLRKR